MGPTLMGKRLPTWGVSSHPTIVDVPVQLQGDYTTSQKQYEQSIAFYNINQRLVSFIQKPICARVAKGF